MSEVSTRWEWRIFGPRLTAAEKWLASHRSTGVQESDDIYFLSGSGGVTKLRSDLMDIKVLREVDGDGLERWEPVMKAGFPLQVADVKRVSEASQLAPPTVARSAWSIEEFIHDFAGSAGPLRAVRVHKRRVRYAIDGCTLELSDVVGDDRPTRTLAVESEEAKVSIVGIGMKSHSGVAATMFEALAEKGINIEMISTSEIKISVVVEDKYMELAVRALHKAFGLDQAAA